MDLLAQVTQLLSEPSGNIVYHLVTLFSLQAVFGISFSQWRRNRDSKLLSRFAVAALGIILGRIALLLLGLGASIFPWTTAVLPLLEQALNTGTIFALIWAIVPPIASLPRLNDLVLVIGILIVGAMIFSFYPGWQAASAEGNPYNGTTQDAIWTIVQMALLIIGLSIIIFDKGWRYSLSPLILGILLITAVLHLLAAPASLPGGGSSAIWMRLGHFVAFPLWAVLAYQQTVLPLLRLNQEKTPTARLAQLLKQAGQTLTALNTSEQLSGIIQLAETVINPSFIGVAAVDTFNKSQLLLISNQPQANNNAPRSWEIQIGEWSSLQVPMNQQRPLEINMSGAGAGQLYRFAERLTLGELEALLIQPIIHQRQAKGVFIVGERNKPDFSTETKMLVEALAAYSGEILAAHVPSSPDGNAVPPEPSPQLHSISPGSNEIISGRIITLEQERDRLLEKIKTTDNKLKQAEERAIDAMQRAQDLAASLEVLAHEPDSQTPDDSSMVEQLERLQQERDQLIINLETANGLILQSEVKIAEMQKQNQTDQEKTEKRSSKHNRVNKLEREVESLRESLEEAEEAMAMAAAGQSDISTEWVMLTITRYSSQLEQAQAKIEMLEKELARRSPLPMNQVLISVIQELRTPMTSIAGFTDLLLGGSLGNFGVKQRDLLQRIQANADRMGNLLNQIMLLTPENPRKSQESPALEKIDVREAVETAVTSAMTQIREKRIHLDMDIAPELPQMTIKRNAFHQIVTSLLDNACIASGTDGNISISVYPRQLNRSDVQHDQPLTFIELTISDSGDGISTEDLANVFAAHYNPEEPLIAGLGDTTASLSVAHALTTTNGGRLWVDSEKGKGSVFSLLFPLTPSKDNLFNGSTP